VLTSWRDIILIRRHTSQHIHDFFVWASSYSLPGRSGSRGRCWAAIRLAHYPEPSNHAFHVEVVGLVSEGQHGQRRVRLRRTHKSQKGHTYPICVSIRSGSVRPSAEAIKPDTSCSWQGHSRRDSADFGDESTESRSALQRRTSVVFVRWTDESFCCGYKWVFLFQMPCVSTRWKCESWVEQTFRLHAQLSNIN